MWSSFLVKAFFSPAGYPRDHLFASPLAGAGQAPLMVASVMVEESRARSPPRYGTWPLVICSPD